LEQDNSHQTWQSFEKIAQLVDQAYDSEVRVKLEDELARINMLAKALYMKTHDMVKVIADSKGTATQGLFSKTIVASIIGCDAGRRLNSLAMFMAGANERPGGNA
jgi:hypothetical protein